ncbi:hypothetical protein CCR75_009018 [Bremia lactucae]|uniref:Uncharacterized protein n=1 Tax=Bremia lactucae TaxID=4779 RepID=A0A976FP13_BRELC|nr:hypothetical protein CCR75_009018 [Bremia lactucae]
MMFNKPVIALCIASVALLGSTVDASTEVAEAYIETGMLTATMLVTVTMTMTGMKSMTMEMAGD